jgi:hypothetical protein
MTDDIDGTADAATGHGGVVERRRRQGAPRGPLTPVAPVCESSLARRRVRLARLVGRLELNNRRTRPRLRGYRCRRKQAAAQSTLNYAAWVTTPSSASRSLSADNRGFPVAVVHRLCAPWARHSRPCRAPARACGHVSRAMGQCCFGPGALLTRQVVHARHGSPKTSASVGDEQPLVAVSPSHFDRYVQEGWASGPADRCAVVHSEGERAKPLRDRVAGRAPTERVRGHRELSREPAVRRTSGQVVGRVSEIAPGARAAF